VIRDQAFAPAGVGAASLLRPKIAGDHAHDDLWLQQLSRRRFQDRAASVGTPSLRN
jgi:hypothetical protein